MPFFFASFSCALLTVAACASDKTAVQSGNGVNDVRAACDIRATWASSLSDKCGQCRGRAITPYCSCFGDPNSAACESQENALEANTTCDSVSTCVANCKNDCTCSDACYTGHDDCRKLASAVDGCVAQLCDSDCR